MHFYQKNNKKGFTLIEILVVIALISMLAVSALNTNFNPSDSEKLNIFNSEIIKPIEEIKNNSLVGKGVIDSSGKLNTPDYWEIIISPNNLGASKGKIISRYNIDGADTIYNEYNVKKTLSIDKIECNLLDDTTEELENDKQIIIKLEGSKMSITSDSINCASNIKEILLTTSILSGKKSLITINKLSGVIQTENNKVSN
ncbi:MAG: prepilin-type N-terminal cleavage/methylation domain-containing protein [Candidatus Gracilibacteria bacterium]|nr:prepilin-type N-terminal cleavage/methylation domain-containing protein [Candidatus Gracilibacteria bacterium]